MGAGGEPELDVDASLERVVAALPGGGEARPGQLAMAEAVAAAIEHGRHLVVQAGTGTGKSLAYLVPALLSGRRVVVATATKALQDQLAGKDLPFLTEHLDLDADVAVLKGRSNYVCLQRLREATGGDDQATLELDDLGPVQRGQVSRLAAWAATSPTGDQAELTWAVDPRAWQAVSVSSEECPGATRCPLGEPCFAEVARRRAPAADLVVVNTHLYGLHLAGGEALLPEHDVVVFDEAHQLEDVISATAGLSLGAGRFSALARLVRAVLATDGPRRLEQAGEALAAALQPRFGQRLPDPCRTPSWTRWCWPAVESTRCRPACAPSTPAWARRTSARSGPRRPPPPSPSTSTRASPCAEGFVAFVGGTASAPRLEVAPIDVGRVLAPLWDKRTAVLTSATIPLRLPERLGLPADRTDVLDVGSPFDYDEHALLYCAAHLPDPRNAAFPEQSHHELEALIAAAGGRTLALFTSWRAMQAAADALRPKLPYPVLTQGDLPKPELLAAFAREESSCLFATAGLFQGIDVPGPSLSLVTIDRLPFPRPDDPLLEARRERAGAAPSA